ncbi:hypothetical protein HBI24_073680 [Parastagonospora nodorum]|nr:hypothetical protein HBH82_111080 [Parastagonospora nodorum]KAH4663940.1 hypothetical protein HBH78_208280 [Parastagonospora nodorum]KAH4694008.1 hypothetical protein HBH67_221760 [Parastagonospora nodorum]KAH4791290.1 hypothetical protein HBH62_035060 [Parastagonospora nodorum]KAH4798175.1 hypothetical protein HBH63_075040 [Parastagonospora nodorum]
MPVNTLSVSAAVTPTVIQTYLSHYLNRRPLAQKPTAHISYHEGLELIRRFLNYASFHTVDELQAFTSQWVPVPHWVHVKVVEIAGAQLARSAELISAQLGPRGIAAVGGQNWWQWRRDGTVLSAEWIEMRKDHDARKQLNITKGDRIMLYVHGGAYFFGSVDEHRYQMQRHARKLKARVIAPRYRLAPQFPFPCGLHDCLAVYLHLLEEKHDPNTIILAGDSAGGGMVLSMLVTLRDQGIPLPAGAVLISPWVDLTHSFPSLGGDGKMDYIPAHGFVHKPSMSWPPPNADDLLQYDRARTAQHSAKNPPRVSTSKDNKEDREAQKEAKKDRVRGYSIRSSDQPDLKDVLQGAGEEADTWVSPDGKYSVGPKSMLSVQLDSDMRIEIKDQIQMYAANHLLTHPLVSPALQPTLGGLPPLLIQTGGGELLRDEQIYIAHKAAQPLAYLPPPSNNQTAEEIQAQAARYKPTNVNIQVWDDLCHVCPTLSFTRPAKHMYRSIAQFGAWALARAQKKSIDIVDDDDISFISSGSTDSSESDKPAASDSSLEDPKKAKAADTPTVGIPPGQQQKPTATVGRAGDPLPPFENHMIRQRIDRHGRIYPLMAKEELVALQMPVADVGVPKKGPVSKWMKAQQHWNSKFAKQKIKIQKQRMKDMEKGFEGFDGEIPPPTALAGRRVKGMKAEKPKKRSWGMSMWAGWGSKHDSATIDREKDADHSGNPSEPSTATQKPDQLRTDGAVDAKSATSPKRSRGTTLAALRPSRTRSHSRHSAVTDKGQANTSLEKVSSIAPPAPLAEATQIAPERRASPLPSPTGELDSPENLPSLGPGIVISDHPESPATLIPATDGSSTRPTKGGIAYPFSLSVAGQHANASMLTLDSVGIATPPAVDVPHSEKELSAIDPVVEPSKESGDRPTPERFYTAAPGAGLFSSGAEPEEVEGAQKVDRPPVERFQTAQEDLGLLAMGNGKA